MNGARERLREDLQRLAAIDPADATMHNTLLDMVLQTHASYHAGPWMVLHVLGRSSRTEISELAMFIADQASRQEVADQGSIRQLIRYALEISNEDFLREIYREGWDGKPMLDPNLTGLGAINPRLTASNLHKPYDSLPFQV